MNIAIELTGNELTDDFIKKIKQLSRNKTIQILITDEIDETKHLTRNAANKQHLLEALNDEAVQRFSIEDFVTFSQTLKS